ncbi:GNAT family N-acetyltransferase [Nocardioides sp. CFH 31398]|uniref:GNAT family N-acetyltransferase n=1 Tax=Nocardioides sp. CFH 31398 TaxID=2919579 RepID=UPI001F060A35|nr:GNAT family N-acetyltransferase [Nocardioides sp. CFH 31398]MCH1868697.1 GNAT family N-acetyltransferase [Nocardioides sp. CFH 31398]
MREGLHVLGSEDLEDFLALTALDPVVNCFADYRARTTRLDPRWLGGEVWGRYAEGRLTAACHLGANLVPIGATDDDARAFAERAVRRPRSVSTLVGPQAAVRAFWDVARATWESPRDERWDQPHLELVGEPLVEPDPEVRVTTKADLETLYPACVAMYTEEVGVSPERGGSSALYRARVTQLVSRGWSFARFEDGRVVFKAEVACVSPAAAQIQGVWVPPDRRGEGLATRGMAAVARLVVDDLAPSLSLYVNEWNEPARRAYEACGFRQTATFSTLMF